MFIKSISISNFRIYEGDLDHPFVLDDFSVPNGEIGSGLNVLLGNNGTGKTSILDAIGLCLSEYRGDSVSIADFNDMKKDLFIRGIVDKSFEYRSVLPTKISYEGKGFQFKANMRVKNATYLASPVVHDLTVIKTDKDAKPDDKAPDIRVSVRNPWAGDRFPDFGFTYIEKNRPYSIKTGTFNDTRFDRIMEDLNRQVLHQEKSTKDIDVEFDKLKKDLNSHILTHTIQNFRDTVGISVNLKAIDPFHPFDRAFLAHVTPKGIHLSLNQMGSGYEMIFSLLYLLSSIEEKQREEIVLIDEPELHLHPALQEQFVQALLKLSKVAQIIITTHSPLLLKQLFLHCKVNTKVLRKEGEKVQSYTIEERVLSHVSANEINYLAFDLVTTEYFNELYGELMERLDLFKQGPFDTHLAEHYQVTLDKKWKNCKDNKEYHCSLFTYIRNFIHHPENTQNSKYSQAELSASVERIRDILKQCPQQCE